MAEVYDWWMGCCTRLEEFLVRVLLGRWRRELTRRELEARHRARLAESDRWLRDAQARYRAIMALPNPLELFLEALNPKPPVPVPVPQPAPPPLPAGTALTGLAPGLAHMGMSAAEAAAAMRAMVTAVSLAGPYLTPPGDAEEVPYAEYVRRGVMTPEEGRGAVGRELAGVKVRSILIARRSRHRGAHLSNRLER